MIIHPFREFDSVVVLVPVRDRNGATFPAGTRAAIVDLGPDYAFVEIFEQDGTGHGPYDVSLTDLRLIEHAQAA
jgi:hypothetical protein